MKRFKDVNNYQELKSYENSTEKASKYATEKAIEDMRRMTRKSSGLGPCNYDFKVDYLDHDFHYQDGTDGDAIMMQKIS